MKKILLLSSIFILFSLIISGQEPASVKQFNGGVLNGKATNLPRPAFPAAARAVKASGAVSVQVLIDEQGNVASATAVSGHPLLRQTAEQAALAAKFSPTTLSGQPVKVSGIITYNFVSSMSFTQIGFDLALIENSKELPKNIFVGNIRANVPKEWEKEQSNLFVLENVTREPLMTKPNQGGIGIGNFEGVKTVTSENYSSGNKLRRVEGIVKTESVDRIKVAEELQKDIDIRLADDKENLWKFKVGKVLGSIAAQNEDEYKIKSDATHLNDLIASAPSEISSYTLENLRKLVELIQSSDTTPESKTVIKNIAEKSKNL